MRFIYNIFIILISSIFLFSCGDLKLKKKASSGEEFLIEKKDPLILPPDFSKLPTPNEQPETVDDDVNIKSVFDGDLTSSEKDNNQSSSKSNIKKSISEKIQKQ
tara:strand:- start:1762 stop:2073 length:312 start_codon:yes stop_codon:yes gene_type:complete